MEPSRAEKSFAAKAESVARARRFAIDSLAGIPTDRSVVELLTGELAANAVMHADSEFRVRVSIGSESVRVEIVNDEPEMLLSLKDPTGEGGRGLHIVKALAQDWGTESSRDEKIVWFAVAIADADEASVEA